MGHRPQLESLLCKVNEAAPEKPQVLPDHRGLGKSGRLSLVRSSLGGSLTLGLLGLQEDSGTAGGISSTSASVNRYILQLAQEYCGDCKNSFDELSKIIQVENGSSLQWVPYAFRAAFAPSRLPSQSNGPAGPAAASVAPPTLR